MQQPVMITKAALDDRGRAIPSSAVSLTQPRSHPSWLENISAACRRGSLCAA